MTYVKRIVCLANSLKTGGSCIAGREILENGSYGGWIRPVSARPTAEITFAEYKYENKASPKLLDVLDVPILKTVPPKHQTENCLIDAGRRWIKVDKVGWGELEGLCERPTSLWANGHHTNSGYNDCMSPVEAAGVCGSLALIKPDNFVVEVGKNEWTEKRSYRGRFEYNGTRHKLSLTDPVAREYFADKEEEDYLLNGVYLCISLTEPYDKDGRCHKLAAAMIKNPPF